ncbi:hypothetical protein ACFL0W_04175 [Nanoarchaeota archaeon]
MIKISSKIQRIESEEIANGSAIDLINELTEELIDISQLKREKYPFRKEYSDKLINKIKAKTGKSLISLEDLSGPWILKFNETGCKILTNLMMFIKEKYGIDRTLRKDGVNFYLINDSIIKGNCSLTVDTIRKYFKFLQKQKINISGMNDIHKRAIQIKTSIKSKPIKINGLPINMKDEKWALIFGIILDTHLRKFEFVAEDRDFAQQVRLSFREVGIEPYFQNKGNLTKIKGHSIISHLINFGGIETNKKQLIANNHLPSWMFLCSKKYHGILLSKFIDTEGYVPKGKNGVRIAQSSFIEINEPERQFVLTNSKTNFIKPVNVASQSIVFSKLNKILKEKVLSNPPLILVSSQLLLRKYKINSTVYPIHLYISSNNIASAGWHLAIFGFNNLKNLNDLCGKYLSIKYKKDALKNILEQQKSECLPLGLRINYYLANAKQIQNAKGYFTTKDLIKVTNKKKKTVYNTVGYLAKLKLIKTIDKVNSSKFWVLTEKSHKILEKTCNNKEQFDHLFR